TPVDKLTVQEVHGVKVARDAGPDLNGIDGDKAADVFIPLGHPLPGGLGHGHLWRRWGHALGLRLAPLAAGEARHEQEEKECGDGQRPGRSGKGHGVPGMLMMLHGSIWALQPRSSKSLAMT